MVCVSLVDICWLKSHIDTLLDLVDGVSEDVVLGAIEEFVLLSGEEVVADHGAERVGHDRHLSLEARLCHRESTHNHVHLHSHGLEDARAEARIQVGQVVWNCLVEDFFGALPVGGNRDPFESLAKAERVLQLSLPVNNVRHDLILTVEVATFYYFADSYMQLLLPCLLSVEVRPDSVDEKH